MKKILLSLIFVPFLTLNQPEIDDSWKYKELTLEDYQSHYLIANSSPVYTSNDVLGQNETKPLLNGQLEGSEGKWDYLLEKYDWNVDEARKIMFCESSYNPEAHNYNHSTRDNSHGLFQINTYGNLSKDRPTREWLIVPENNVAYAYSLWEKNGWRDWRNCAIKNGLL